MSHAQPEMNGIVDSIAFANMFLRKDYLQCLEQATIVNPWVDKKAVEDNLRLIHIDALLYDSTEKISNKLSTLFAAVESYGETVLLILNGKTDRVDFYLGISSDQAPQPVFNTFRRSLSGLLPGCRYTTLHNGAIEELMNEILPTKEHLDIASVCALPSEDSRAEFSGEKLDTLIDGMRHRPFSMILMAKAVPSDDLAAMRQLYMQLYTELSSLEKSVVTVSKSDTESIGKNFSKSVTETIGYNASFSRGHSISKGTSTSEQETPDNTDQKNHMSKLQLAGTATALLLAGTGGAATGAGAVAGTKVLQSLFYGSSLTNVLSSGEQLLGMAPQNQPTIVTVSSHEDTSKNENISFGGNRSSAENKQSGVNLSINTTQGESQQISRTNKAITDLLTVIENELSHISLFQKEGAYNVAAYFIAGDSETAISAANLYRSITTSSRVPTLHSPICSWQEPTQVMMLREYLCRGKHPVFRFPKNKQFPDVQIAQLVGAKDMTNYFCLPESPVPGFIVSPTASFSRDVIVRRNVSSNSKEKSVHIGHIFHMGKEDYQTNVALNVNDLTKHLFVAGATGVGKSNFCYQLLDQLDRQGIPMLIIEPAKGEYRHVLGGRKGFHVYGVDPQREPVLRINPFAYPDGIPTIQHIERLLDIFNTAWPMYSAMPAVLKEAVELVYVEKGFDLLSGKKPQNASFPCFQDLLGALTKVIDQSKYSSEVKGNYKGALETRVRSLTNGIYGIIFSQDELGDHNLFNTNVIADISRIGSAETKALLMGVLTARLVEYRMSEGKMNAPLRHVTVLEEAHNLLRRHNMSSAEGANARAASVEMIASAIAEMRSSGEGFIIADQSPSVMDWSVIRNTQTKVFFMLPEREDRQIASNALSLDDKQERELSKLLPGVAAVYQNGWTDAVLCKINYFEKSMEQPFSYEIKHEMADRTLLTGQAIALLIKRRLKDGKSSVNETAIRELIQTDETLLDYSGKMAIKVLQEYQQGNTHEATLLEDFTLINHILPIGKIIRGAASSKDINQWVSHVECEIRRYAELSDAETDCIISLGLREWMSTNSEVRKLYVRYVSYRLELKNGD